MSERSSLGTPGEGALGWGTAGGAGGAAFGESATTMGEAGPHPSAPSPGVPSDERSLMAELRSVKDRDPVRAEELVCVGNARYPNSSDAPERASILIHAFAAQGRASDVRGEAEDMVNRYPISSWVREIEAFTGAHRHGDVRLTDAGQLVMD